MTQKFFLLSRHDLPFFESKNTTSVSFMKSTTFLFFHIHGSVALNLTIQITKQIQGLWSNFYSSLLTYITASCTTSVLTSLYPPTSTKMMMKAATVAQRTSTMHALWIWKQNQRYNQFFSGILTVYFWLMRSVIRTDACVWLDSAARCLMPCKVLLVTWLFECTCVCACVYACMHGCVRACMTAWPCVRYFQDQTPLWPSDEVKFIKTGLNGLRSTEIF